MSQSNLQSIEPLPFPIAHVTDVHFWEIVRNPLKLINKRLLGNLNVILKRSKHFHQHLADDFAANVIDTGAKTVIFGGDFTSTATDSEFERARHFVDIFEKAGLRIVLMPGNHDVYTFESVRAARFESCFSRWLPEGGYPSRYDLVGGGSLLVVPTVCPNILSSRGRITAEELEKVGAMIGKVADRPLLIAGHYPFLHNTSSYSSNWERKLGNAEALHELLGSSNQPLTYIAGHVHRFSYVTDRLHERIRHLTTPAFFYHRSGTDVCGAFTVLEPDGDYFRITLHQRKQFWSAEVQSPL